MSWKETGGGARRLNYGTIPASCKDGRTHKKLTYSTSLSRFEPAPHE